MPHIHDKIDFTVEVFIVHDDKVLLRKHDKYKIWLSIGGHVELDEDPNQTVVREAKEEVGLNITLVGKAPGLNDSQDYKELVSPVFLNRHRINDTHEHVTLTYFATSKSADVVQGIGEVSEELRWFTKEELDDPKYDIKEHIKQYAKAALET